MTSLLESLIQDLRSTVRVQSYGDSELVTLPHAFEDGSLISFFVTHEGDGQVVISDRGRAADVLDVAGVDLSAKRTAASWHLVRESSRLPPAFGAQSWEISALVPSEDVGAALRTLTEVSLRADGLRALSGRARARTFAERIQAVVADRFPMIPRAPISLKQGSERQVTCSIQTPSGTRYVQALSGGDNETASRSYDHARSLFSDANEDKDNLVALFQGDSQLWQAWQVGGLKVVARVGFENSIEETLAELAA